MNITNTKFNAVTKDFQTKYRKIVGGKDASHTGVRRRKFYKRLANRAARRSWFDGIPRATGWDW